MAALRLLKTVWNVAEDSFGRNHPLPGALFKYGAKRFENILNLPIVGWFRLLILVPLNVSSPNLRSFR